MEACSRYLRHALLTAETLEQRNAKVLKINIIPDSSLIVIRRQSFSGVKLLWFISMYII